jgi:F-type H+-transporting ATPase subunit epsilon
MQLEIVNPEEKLFEGEVKSVRLPGSDGSFGILNNHAPIVATLKKGSIVVTDNNNKEHIFEVNGGVVEVSDNRASILAD